MRFACEQCKTKYSIDDARVKGKVLKIRCKSCGNVITVREQPGGTPAAVAVVTPAQKPLQKALDHSLSASASARASDSGFGESDEHTMVSTAAMLAPALAAAAAARTPDWFISIDGEQEGPFVVEKLAERARVELAAGKECHAWRENFDSWLPVTDVPEIARFLAPPPPASPPPPPPRPPAPPAMPRVASPATDAGAGTLIEMAAPSLPQRPSASPAAVVARAAQPATSGANALAVQPAVAHKVEPAPPIPVEDKGKGSAEKIAAEKIAAEKIAAEKKTAAEAAAKDTAAAEAAAKDKAAAEKAAAEKQKGDKADKEKAAADKLKSDKAEKEKAEKAEKSEKASAAAAEKDRAAVAAKEKADKEKADKEKADKEKADKEKADKEKARSDKAAAAADKHKSKPVAKVSDELPIVSARASGELPIMATGQTNPRVPVPDGSDFNISEPSVFGKLPEGLTTSSAPVVIVAPGAAQSSPAWIKWFAIMAALVAVASLSAVGYLIFGKKQQGGPEVPVKVEREKGMKIDDTPVGVNDSIIRKQDPAVAALDPTKKPATAPVAATKHHSDPAHPHDPKATAPTPGLSQFGGDEPTHETPLNLPKTTETAPEKKNASPEEMAAVVKRNMKQVQVCYERELKRDNTARGRIEVNLKITGAGRVNKVEITDSNASQDLNTCLQGTIKKWIFPASGSEYEFGFPLILQAN